jgi:hypothetical protein
MALRYVTASHHNSRAAARAQFRDGNALTQGHGTLLVAGEARLDMLSSQAICDVAPPKVRLVGSPAAELDARNERVVIGEIAGDESIEPDERIQRVEVEPSTAELTPQSFNHRIGLNDIDLYDDMLGESDEVGILLDDEVFRAAVGHDLEPHGVTEPLPCLVQDAPRSFGAQARLEGPCEDAAREVVNGCVEIRASSIEQADDGHKQTNYGRKGRGLPFELGHPRVELDDLGVVVSSVTTFATPRLSQERLVEFGISSPGQGAGMNSSSSRFICGLTACAASSRSCTCRRTRVPSNRIV